MRLYRIMGTGWAGTQADAKAAAKDARRPFHETEVPTDKPGLLAWLNERNVPARPEELEEITKPPLDRDPMDHVDDAAAYLRGPKTKDPPRVSPAFLGALERGAEFVPVDQAAEIDRLLERCPKCHGGWTAQVLAGIAAAPIAELELITNSIKNRLEEGGSDQ